MKVKSLILAASCAWMVYSPVYAASAEVLDDGTVVIHHYSGEVAETQDEAIALLISSLQQTQEVITGSNLDDVALEDIHKISYSMENAVEALQQYSEPNSLLSEKLGFLAETVEEMHVASEDRDGALTVQSFVRVQFMSDEIINAFEQS